MTELPYFVYAGLCSLLMIFSLSATIPSLGFVLSTDRLCSALKVIQSLAKTAKTAQDLSMKLSSSSIGSILPEITREAITDTLIDTVLRLNGKAGASPLVTKKGVGRPKALLTLHRF